MWTTKESCGGCEGEKKLPGVMMVEEWSVSNYNFELFGGYFSGVREQHSNTACRRPPDCYIFLLEITPYKHIKYVSRWGYFVVLLMKLLRYVFLELELWRQSNLGALSFMVRASLYMKLGK